ARGEGVEEGGGERMGKEWGAQVLTSLTRGGAIEMSPLAYWKQSSTEVLAHYADARRPIVVSFKVGKGQVIWWAASTPLSNFRISKSGNLDLLLNSLGGAKENRVLSDESFHTSHRTAMS